MSFTGFYPELQGFTEFYWVLGGFCCSIRSRTCFFYDRIESSYGKFMAGTRDVGSGPTMPGHIESIIQRLIVIVFSSRSCSFFFFLFFCCCCCRWDATVGAQRGRRRNEIDRIRFVPSPVFLLLFFCFCFYSSRPSQPSATRLRNPTRTRVNPPKRQRPHSISLNERSLLKKEKIMAGTFRNGLENLNNSSQDQESP